MLKLYFPKHPITNNERTGVYVKNMVFNHDFRGLQQ